MSISMLRHVLHPASLHVSSSFLRRHSLFPCHVRKRGNVEPGGNNLLKEFHPAGKRVKSLPLVFVFIPVTNQIPKESWKKFKGKRMQAMALLYPPCDSQQDFYCTFLCSKCSVECYFLILIFHKIGIFFAETNCRLTVTSCCIINGRCFIKSKSGHCFLGRVQYLKNRRKLISYVVASVESLLLIAWQKHQDDFFNLFFFVTSEVSGSSSIDFFESDVVQCLDFSTCLIPS